MKKLLFVCLFYAVNSVYGQDTVGMHLPIKDGHLIYEGVIDQPGKSKIDLYNNARQWFVDYFKSSKDVIQNEDKDQGRIIGKGIIKIPWKTFAGSGFYDCKITIQVDVKNEKYRYKIYDFILNTTVASLSGGAGSRYEFTPEELVNKLTGNGKVMVTKGQCKKLLISIDEESRSTVASLTTAMAAKADNF